MTIYVNTSSCLTGPLDDFEIDTSELTAGGFFNIDSSSLGDLTIDTSSLSNNYIYSTITGYSTENRDDLVVGGHSLKKFMESVEKRLAILEDPDPEKLERYAALRKAYEHYKTLERLIGDE